MTDWCILRCSGPHTLRLAEALRAEEIAAWAPTATVEKREGRDRKRILSPAAMMPTFVFADHARLPDLVSVSPEWKHWNGHTMATRGVPAFRFFRQDGRIPRIQDRALDPLRAMERRQIPPQRAVEAFFVGQAVLYPAAGFEGLSGAVTAIQGRFAIVSFPGLPIPVKIDARHLRPSQLAA